MRVSHGFAVSAAVIAMIAAVFFAYGNALGNGFVSWDDYMLVLFNPAVHSHVPGTWTLAWTTYDPELYIPLTLLSFRLEHWLFGLSPFAFHADNILLHTANALLVAALAWRWSGRRFVGLLTGFLFALHPTFTEAVVWVSARKDLLATFFFLATLFCFFRYRADTKRLWYYGSLVLFLCGLLSKIMVVPLPIVLLLHDILLIGKRTCSREWIYEMIPFFMLSAVFGLIGIMGKGTHLDELQHWPLALLWAKMTSVSLTRLVAPGSFSIIADIPKALVLVAPQFIVSATMLFVGIIVIVARWKRWPHLAFGVLFFLVTALPNLLSLSHGRWVSVGQEKYDYLPFVGMLYLAALAIGHPAIRRTASHVILAGTVVIVAAWWVPMIRAHTLDWRSDESLYRATLESDPDIPYPYLFLGTTYAESGDLHAADDILRRGLDVLPTSEELHAARAKVLLMSGDTQGAGVSIRKALANRSGRSRVDIVAARIALREGRTDDAIALLNGVLAFFPDSYEARYLFERAQAEKDD